MLRIWIIHERNVRQKEEASVRNVGMSAAFIHPCNLKIRQLTLIKGLSTPREHVVKGYVCWCRDIFTTHMNMPKSMTENNNKSVVQDFASWFEQTKGWQGH